MISVALVDDHNIVRQGFVELLGHEDDISVAYQCDSIKEQMTWLEHNRADVLVVDLSFQNGSGFELLDNILNKDGMPTPVVLSMHDKDPHVTRAIEKGAKGYVSKCSSPEELVTAIRAVHAGQNYLCGAVISNLKFRMSDKQLVEIETLTEREREIFDCLAIGMEIKHIARKLNIASKTVHVHRSHLMKKLDVNTSFDITKMALKCGLLTTDDLIS